MPPSFPSSPPSFPYPGPPPPTPAPWQFPHDSKSERAARLQAQHRNYALGAPRPELAPCMLELVCHRLALGLRRLVLEPRQSLVHLRVPGSASLVLGFEPLAPVLGSRIA
ncbi:hypothetical protein RSOL_248620 [Rhizoctonia solani AG-3 Rhs1AP]|uniref:Uncharacterized protein n=2 Tax=Rhizoctonia solani AG-3 TaxID=1086053 RepID=A0A074S1J8_9AGAM|nr:hypothetical protein RSOL_248620 [Rhizoctonia solani AG-3 Rhs1AP]KEP51435.1 hypothetical protein V565_061640 [Rhizoctonia solani 123E]